MPEPPITTAAAAPIKDDPINPVAAVGLSEHTRLCVFLCDFDLNCKSFLSVKSHHIWTWKCTILSYECEIERAARAQSNWKSN